MNKTALYNELLKEEKQLTEVLANIRALLLYYAPKENEDNELDKLAKDLVETPQIELYKQETEKSDTPVSVDVKILQTNLNEVKDKTPKPKHIKGGHLTLKDHILDIVKSSNKPLSNKEITTILNSSKVLKNDVASSNVYNALVVLQKEGKLIKDHKSKPITWTLETRHMSIGIPYPDKKAGQPISSQLYATDTDRINFAKEAGFKNIDEAIKKMGSWAFEAKLRVFVRDKNLKLKKAQ